MSSRRSFTTKSGGPGRYLSLLQQQNLCSLNTCSTTAQKQVVLKCAPQSRLQREKEILQEVSGDVFIRQLIDCGKETAFLVLEHLESGALKSPSETSPGVSSTVYGSDFLFRSLSA